METETRTYEISYLLRGDLGEEKVQETAEALRQAVEEENGIITQENKPQKQNLSYPIKKHEAAYFGLFKFLFPADKLRSFQKSLLKFDFLRFLLNQIKQPREISRRSASLPAPTCPRFALASARRGRQGEKLQRKDLLPKKEEILTKESLQVEEIDKRLEEILGE